jgi:hypothetical protein
VAAGDNRYDLGLAVKDARNELCVPGYAVPANGGSGWMYSTGLAAAVAKYRATHPWVLQMLDVQQDGASFRLDAALPNDTPEQRTIKVGGGGAVGDGAGDRVPAGGSCTHVLGYMG